MKKFTVIVSLLLQTALGFAETSLDLNDARVTLSYKELKSLIEAAQLEKSPPPSKPPIASALLSARYQIAIVGSRAEGMIEIEAQSFSDDWTAVPLIETGIPIDWTDPADARVIVNDGHYALITEHSGRSKIQLHFATQLAAGNGGQILKIPFASAPIRTLTLTGNAEGKMVQIDGGTLISNEKGIAKFVMSDHEKNVMIKLLTPQEAPIPSHWKIETESVAQYSKGTLSYQTEVTAIAEGGSGLEMDLVLPASAQLLDVTGEDLQSWTRNKTVHLRWKTRNLLSREVRLSYEITQPASTGIWKLVAPGVNEGEVTSSLFAVTGEQGMEIQAGTPVSQRASRRLMQEIGGRNAVIAGGDGSINVQWLPLMPTTPAVIDSAQSSMRMVSDGGLINEISYSIRHEGPITWQLHLPDASQLLTCRVNEHALSPVDRGNGVIELALDAPEHRSVTEVKLSYTAHKEAFNPVSGRIALELPQTELLIQKLNWSLQIPAGYELSAMEGNVESGVTDRSGAIQLHKELCKNEQPGLRIYYQKTETKKQ